MCPKPRIPFFLFTSIGGSETTHLGWSIGSCISFLWGSHVRRKFWKRTTLRSKSSTLKGLVYAPIQQKQYHKRTTLRRLKIPLQSMVARKVRTIAWAKRDKAVIRQAKNAVNGMGTLKIPLWSIHSEEGPHYHLGAKREEAVIRQGTINLIHGLEIPWWFHTRVVLRSLANARKCQLKDFCEKERYESCSVLRTLTSETFDKRRKRGKFTSSEATTRFPQASSFEKPMRSVPETWGCMYDVLALKKIVSSYYAKILKVATKIIETCEKTLFTPPSPMKTTNSIVSV